MNEITRAEWLAEGIKELWFKNDLIARKFCAGQFVIVHQGGTSERIPLTIVESSEDSVRLVIQDVGYSTSQLCSLEIGDHIEDVAGPLGRPSEIKQYGKVVCLAGGIGAAPLKPVASALKDKGNNLTIIQGARCADLVIMESELSEISDEFILTTDDGSRGERALVTEPLLRCIKNGPLPDYVFAVGPPVMMRAVSKITKESGIPLTVSMNPIMVDGTGMCGSCRVDIAGEVKFACVDGPEFDGNKVDFDLLINRLNMYLEEEKIVKHPGGCRCGNEK